MKVIEAITALALTAPVLAFYFVIASEAFVGPREQYVLVAPTAFASICSAYGAKR
jgi:hypothetical protein